MINSNRLEIVANCLSEDFKKVSRIKKRDTIYILKNEKDEYFLCSCPSGYDICYIILHDLACGREIDKNIKWCRIKYVKFS